MSHSPRATAERIKARALDLGFTSAGITDLQPTPHGDALDRWLARGFAGTMRYMHRQAARRREPHRIAPAANRAIVVTRNYYNVDPPIEAGRGRIAKYARGRDYHEALAEPLRALADYVRAQGAAGTFADTWTDAGPVPERELAQRAGLGWIGKNTMLIDPKRGSYFFLASVFTDLDVAVDVPFATDRCGSCTRCLEACPTDAFPEAHVLDATRCISYLTIEYRGDIHPDLGAALGDWIFGCDICQDVCPWNEKFASVADDAVLGTAPERFTRSLDEWAAIDEETFAAEFGDTALTRAGARGLRRNAAIALANRKRGTPCPTR